MKKSIAVICFLSLIFFSTCGCNNKGKITVADAGYTCDAIVSYGENFSLNATIDAIGGGVFTLTVNEPKNISGLVFSFNRDEMHLAYDGINKTNKIPSGYGGFAEILNEIFLKLTIGKLVVSGESGEYIYKGNTSDYPFTVVFNEQGFPTTIMVEKKSLKATFSNWKY